MPEPVDAGFIHLQKPAKWNQHKVACEVKLKAEPEEEREVAGGMDSLSPLTSAFHAFNEAAVTYESSSPFSTSTRVVLFAYVLAAARTVNSSWPAPPRAPARGMGSAAEAWCERETRVSGKGNPWSLVVTHCRTYLTAALRESCTRHPRPYHRAPSLAHKNRQIQVLT